MTTLKVGDYVSRRPWSFGAEVVFGEIAYICDDEALVIVDDGIERCWLLSPDVGTDINGEPVYQKVDEKYRDRAALWISIDRLKLEKKSNMSMDKLKNSGTKMANAAKHGVAVGAATEGADFTYNLAANWLHGQLGVSREKLEDPVVREVVTLASIAMIHVASTLMEDRIPGMDKVQTGCELVIEGKAKDNSQALMKVCLPVLTQLSSVMDPEVQLANIANQVTKNMTPPQPRVTVPEQQEEEAVVDEGQKSAAGNSV